MAHVSIALRRVVRFCQALACLHRVHAVLDRDGFDGARGLFLLPPHSASKSAPLTVKDPRVWEIEWAVQQACAWYWKRSVCLHRAFVVYSLLRAAGWQPRFIVGVMARPFASHAWVEADGVAVGDSQMADCRHHYRPMLRLPG